MLDNNEIIMCIYTVTYMGLDLGKYQCKMGILENDTEYQGAEYCGMRSTGVKPR